MSALTNGSAVSREMEVEEKNEPQVAPAVTPKKVKSLLDVSAFKTTKAKSSGDSMVGRFKQSGYQVRKPGTRDFFRVHPSVDYRLYGASVMEDDDHRVHVVKPGYELPENAERFAYVVTLLTCITQKGNVFLWHIRESDNEWSRSANTVAKMALTEWVRTRANMAANCYDTEQGPEELQNQEPVWPELSFEEILNSAFEGRIVDKDDYPLIKQLQGRA